MFRIAILPTLLALLLAPSALAASAGDPDTTFDGDGRQVLPVVASPAELLRQPDGKHVIAGTIEENFGVWRLNANGGLDPSFDPAAVADFGMSDYATSATLQADGKILVAGSIGYGYGVARFTATGAPDETFDPGGKEGAGEAVLPSGTAEGIVAQADGRIAVLGYGAAPGKTADFVITRLKANGAPDDAKAPEAADFGGEDYVVAGTAAPGGKLLAVGTSKTAKEQVVAVARWNADGSLDKTFAQTGMKKLGAGTPATVTAQPDGKVLVVLRAENGDPTVVRLTDAGEVDAGFGDGGTTKRVFDGEKLAYDFSAAARPDGRIYGAGTPLGATGFGVGRLGQTGALDPAFGAGGVAAMEFPNIAVATAMAVQPDGKVVVAGVTLQGVAARLAVVRVLGDAPPPVGGPAPDTRAPAITGARVTNRRFAPARGRTARTARVRRGTAFVFRLSETARTEITIARKRGRRHVRAVRLTRAGTRQGVNRVAFTGRVGRRALARGQYRAAIVATDAAGNRSAPAFVRFRVVR